MTTKQPTSTRGNCWDNPQPHLLHHAPGLIQPHLLPRHLAEQTRPAPGSDGHEIGSPKAIIVPLEADGSAMTNSRIIPVIQEATPRLTPSPIRVLSFRKRPLRGDVGAVGRLSAQSRQPSEGGVLDGGFGDAANHRSLMRSGDSSSSRLTECLNPTLGCKWLRLPSRNFNSSMTSCA